jgi:hypothetical protein
MPRLGGLLAVVLALALSTTGLVPATAAPTPDTRFGIAEGFRNHQVMAETGAGFERLIFPWDQIQPNGPSDFSNLGHTLSHQDVQGELGHGIRIGGLLEFTPEWAAVNPADGKRAVPKNLDLTFDDPQNYFGEYVFQTVKYYAGEIDTWIIWNEPEFRPGDIGAGGSFTWLGSDEQFAQLMKVGYLAAKKANPNATVSFSGTSYWVDELAQPKRDQFYDRYLAITSRDPAAAGGFYHDAVSINLYRAADDVYRVYDVFKSIQRKYGIDKPVWLSETNAMPTDDAAIPCPERYAGAAIPTTMDQQAAYAVQAYALAAAAGYSKIEFYQMIDNDPCAEPAVWGVTRDDGSRRPVADALRVAIGEFAGFQDVRFAPLVRETTTWSAWPEDPSSYVPNWRVYEVAFDKPDRLRVTALWNGDGTVLRARIRKNGSSATGVDRRGERRPLHDRSGWWVVDLPAATAYYQQSETNRDPAGYHFIGGDPVVIEEQGVDPKAAVVAPALGDPGSVPREFKLFVTPADGQTVARGQPADFFIKTVGYEGFDDGVSLSATAWSTQRFPEPRDASTLPLALTYPSTTHVGTTASVRVDTASAPEPGIYYITLRGEGGGVTDEVTLSLVLD